MKKINKTEISGLNKQLLAIDNNQLNYYQLKIIDTLSVFSTDLSVI